MFNLNIYWRSASASTVPNLPQSLETNCVYKVAPRLQPFWTGLVEVVRRSRTFCKVESGSSFLVTVRRCVTSAYVRLRRKGEIKGPFYFCLIPRPSLCGALLIFHGSVLTLKGLWCIIAVLWFCCRVAGSGLCSLLCVWGWCWLGWGGGYRQHRHCRSSLQVAVNQEVVHMLGRGFKEPVRRRGVCFMLRWSCHLITLTPNWPVKKRTK